MRCRKRPSAAHINQSAAYATPGNPALKNYHLCYTGNSNLMNCGFILKWGSLGFFRGKELKLIEKETLKFHVTLNITYESPFIVLIRC